MLILSKRTRLNMVPGLFEEVKSMSQSDKDKELGYIFSTISSSLEFVDYTMLICGVTRAFTHQLVRHRVGVSFAQQSMRTVDMSAGFDWLATGSCASECDGRVGQYTAAMATLSKTYKELVASGALPQDARGLIPTNALKAQGEFQQVAKAIKDSVLKIHPWAEPVLRVHCAKHGSCAFPRVTDCPVKHKFPSLISSKDFLKEIQNYRDLIESEAKPIGGK
jgi:hypothetical protein